MEACVYECVRRVGLNDVISVTDPIMGAKTDRGLFLAHGFSESGIYLKKGDERQVMAGEPTICIIRLVTWTWWL